MIDGVNPIDLLDCDNSRLPASGKVEQLVPKSELDSLNDRLTFANERLTFALDALKQVITAAQLAVNRLEGYK